MKEGHLSIYKNVVRQLNSSVTTEPIQVANGYTLDTLVKVIEDIYKNDKKKLSTNKSYLSNYIEFVYFIMAVSRVRGKEAKKKEFSKVFYKNIVGFLESHPKQ